MQWTYSGPIFVILDHLISLGFYKVSIHPSPRNVEAFKVKLKVSFICWIIIADTLLYMFLYHLFYVPVTPLLGNLLQFWMGLWVCPHYLNTHSKLLLKWQQCESNKSWHDLLTVLGGPHKATLETAWSFITSQVIMFYGVLCFSSNL